MPQEHKRNTIEECHHHMATSLFNRVWELLDKPGRTIEENDEMIHSAHASRCHWAAIGEPVNLARGEWQVSRVYAVLSRPEPALYHAARSLAICEANGIGDFDLGFALEAMARAHALAGDDEKAAHYMARARDAAEKIAKPEDRDYFEGELKTMPGWGDQP